MVKSHLPNFLLMKKINIRKFFETCLSKSLLYMGKNAICLFSEADNCYFITQVEDDEYESIYEDQIKEIFIKDENSFKIVADNGEETVVTI